jgi:hypothetical protein
MTIQGEVLDPVVRIRCDKCGDAFLLARHRTDAHEAGWTWPNDGAFHWCYKCTEEHKDHLREIAVPIS